jgi:hypothetical protein
MKKTVSDKCKCPFCEAELVMSCVEPEFCKPCGITMEKGKDKKEKKTKQKGK